MCMQLRRVVWGEVEAGGWVEWVSSAAGAGAVWQWCEQGAEDAASSGTESAGTTHCITSQAPATDDETQSAVSTAHWWGTWCPQNTDPLSVNYLQIYIMCRPERGPEIPEILKSVLKCPEIH